MGKFSILFFIFTLFSASRPQELNGIILPTKETHFDEKTLIDFTHDSPFKVTSSFDVSCKISFYNPSFYGRIFTADSKDLKFNLVYIQFMDPDTSRIKLVVDERWSPLEIKIPKSMLIRNKWHHLSFGFDFEKGSVYLKFDHLSASAAFKKPAPKTLDFYLGAVKSFQELPYAALKDITIKADLENYLWELYPTDQNIIYDKYSKRAAGLKKPYWRNDRRKNWTRTANLSIDRGSNIDVAFRKDDNKIYIFTKKYYYIYDPARSLNQKIFYRNDKPSSTDATFYNPVLKCFISYFNGAEGEISFLKDNSWLPIDMSNDVSQRYYGHNFFTDPHTGEMHTFGGYGWYIFKNHLRRYNTLSREWEIISTWGDTIPPRFIHASALVHDTLLYIIGGHGNESGLQELGDRDLHDIYTLNLKTYETKKLFDWSGTGYQIRTNSSAVFMEEDTAFYFIGNDFIRQRYNQLFKLTLSDSSVTPVGRPHHDYPWETFFNLFYSPVTKEFYTVVRESEKAVIYALLHEKGAVKKNAESSPFYYWAAPALLLLLGYILYKMKKKEKVSVSKYADFNTDAAPDAAPQVTPDPPADKPAPLFAESGDTDIPDEPAETADEYDILPDEADSIFINLWGNFSVFSKSSDFSHLFAPKLKQLFLLLLVYSFDNHRKGISTEKLTNILWPDSSPENSKNLRGVTIRNLRKTLEDVPGIEVTFEQGYWMLSLAPNIQCDLAVYLNIKKSINNPENAGKFTDLIRGEFLADSGYDWLDSYKAAFNNEAGEKLIFILNNPLFFPSLKLSAADALLRLDPVNEEGIKFKVYYTAQENGEYTAKQVYDKLTAAFADYFKIKYPHSFDSIIRKQNPDS